MCRYRHRKCAWRNPRHVQLAGSHTLITIAPFLQHHAFCGERCLAWESATVLSRQEGNNGSAVLPVCLAAFMRHFSEGHHQLLARWALLTRPLPAGHWPVVPTVPAAPRASEGCRLSHSNWCPGSGWSKVPSWLWNTGNFPFSEALAYLFVHLVFWLPESTHLFFFFATENSRLIISQLFIGNHRTLMFLSFLPKMHASFVKINLIMWIQLRLSESVNSWKVKSSSSPGARLCPTAMWLGKASLSNTYTHAQCRFAFNLNPTLSDPAFLILIYLF